MLEAGEPAVEAMTEYARACGQLGHGVPEPVRLHAAYTAEVGLDLHALDADHRALSDAVAAVEEALLSQDGARQALAAAWQGTGADAAADHLLRHAKAAGAGVDGLRAAAVAIGELRDRLSQLIDAKVNATQDIEARGRRAEWLGAARTVTTGAGDRAAASETVDLQVAPFVANDIAQEWVPMMCDTESAIRQAYRDAIAAMAGEATAGFDRAGHRGAIPVAAEQHSIPAATAPAAYAPDPASAAPPAPAQLQAATAPPPAVPADPLAATPGAAPMPAGVSPLGSGMSGLSGLGQSFADILGGLLGAGGQGVGEKLGGIGEFDATGEAAPELGDLDEDDEDDEDEPDGEGADDPLDEDPDGDEPPDGEPEESATPVAPPAEPPAPEPPAPTPVPEPPAEPMTAPAPEPPVEPVPAETPCEIAADALPQAGP